MPDGARARPGLTTAGPRLPLLSHCPNVFFSPESSHAMASGHQSEVPRAFDAPRGRFAARTPAESKGCTARNGVEPLIGTCWTVPNGSRSKRSVYDRVLTEVPSPARAAAIDEPPPRH